MNSEEITKQIIGTFKVHNAVVETVRPHEGHYELKGVISIDKDLPEVEASLQLYYILLNVSVICLMFSSLFINKYPLSISIFVISLLLYFLFPRVFW